MIVLWPGGECLCSWVLGDRHSTTDVPQHVDGFADACVDRTLFLTHEYQGCIQISAMFPHEFFVVVFGILAVEFVKWSAKILLGRRCVCCFAT